MVEAARLGQTGRDGLVDQQGVNGAGQPVGKSQPAALPLAFLLVFTGDHEGLAAAPVERGGQPCDVVAGSEFLSAVEDLEDRAGGEDQYKLHEVASSVEPIAGVADAQSGYVRKENALLEEELDVPAPPDPHW